MKSLVRAALSLALVAALAAGCGSNVQEPGDDAVQPPADTQVDDTGADVGVDVPVPPECETNADCDGRFPDAGPCQVAVCDTAGQCALENTKNYELCDDGDACTETSVCIDGACAGIVSLTCDDGNGCTTDTCDPATGCVFAPATGAACDDGDPCTDEDSCSADGVCEGGAYVCDPCETDGDCAPFEDGDLCNGTLACVDGTCRVDADTRVVCDTSNDPACKETRCVPETGACELQDLADDTACEDGNLCTRDDTCQAGVCEAGSYECPVCETAADCADYAPDNLCLGTVDCVQGECQVDPATVVVCEPTGDPCSVSYCDAADGTCKTRDAVAGTPCDDGDRCTVADRCQAGACEGRDRSCDDGDLCTTDSCDADTGDCVNEPVDCDDGDLCTTDSCDPATGECAFAPVDCDDANPCTTDSCDELTGECLNAPIDCDDENPCTADSCDTDTGECVHVENDCDDGDACTADVCDLATGECVNTPVTCDDGNLCTVDTCDSDTGECAFTPIVCDDQNPCTTDTCDEATGECVFTPVACGDGDVCNGEETCDEATGECVAGEPLVCDDENPCNGEETCDPVDGCQAGTPVVCDDGDPCNGEETCDPQDGSCLPGEPLVCDDDDPCNGVEACTTDVGCEIVTPAPDCDDGIDCTVDSCDPATGECLHDDSACVTPEVDCDDQVDNDEDGATDCDDSDCADLPVCTGVCPQDDFEDNDAIEAAATLTAGDVVSGLTAEFGDDDWFAVELCGGGVLDLQARFTNADGDIDLGLFSAQGQLIAQSVSEDDDEAIAGTILEDGTYFVFVTMFTEGGCNEYELSVGFDDTTCGQEICFDEIDNDGDALVDCEDDDCADDPICQGPVDCEPVTALQCGQQAAGSTIGLVSEIDSYSCDPASPETGGEVVYSFTPDADGDVQIVLEPSDPSVDLDAFVLAPACNTGNCVAAGATFGGEDFTFEAAGGDTYYVAIDGFDGAEGNFTVTVNCFGATTERDCDDGVDNDGDGQIDCSDSDCASDPVCAGPQLCEPTANLVCGDSVTGDTAGGAADLDVYPCALFDSSGPEVAYGFTADVTGEVTLSLSGLAEGEDLDVFVLTGACDAAACLDWGDNELTFAAEAGVTYYVVVDGYQGSASPYTLDVACETATIERECADGIDNDGDTFVDCDDDDCAGAPNCLPGQLCGPVSDIVYGCGDTVSGSTIEGTSYIDAYDCAPWAEPGPDVALPVAIDGVFDVTLRLTTASGADLDLFLMADGCASDACIAAGDSSITFTSDPDVLSYFAVVDGFGAPDVADDFTLTIECDLPTERDCADGIDNDRDGQVDCADLDCEGTYACSVAGTCGAAGTIACEQTIESTTAGEDEVISFYSCLQWDESGPELAYEFTAAEDGPVTFSLAGLDADLDIIVLEGTCEAAACVAQADRFVTIDATAGTTYYVVVDGFEGAAGAFALSATCVPPEPEVCTDGVDNDLDGLVDCQDLDCAADPACAEACEVDAYEPNDSDAEATILRAGEIQTHSICPVADRDWFTFTLAEAADVQLQTDGPTGDTQMTLYDADLNEIAFSDDEGNGLFSFLEIADLAAGTYFVEVNEYNDNDTLAAYAIRLSIQHLCAADATITCADGAVTGSTVGGTAALDGYVCADWDLSGPEVVYEYTPTETVETTFFLSGTTADLDLLVLVDNCGTLDCGAAADNEVAFLAEAGTTYFVVVDGFEGAEGDFTLNIACQPPIERVCDDGVDNDLDGAVDCDDDDCAASPACGPAATCTASGTIACGDVLTETTVGAATDIALYDCATYDESGPELAYELVADTTGIARVTLDGLAEGVDLDLFVLSEACAADRCVAFGGTTGGEDIEFETVEGATYYIVVDGFQGAAGDFTLSLACGDVREVVCDDGLDGDGDGLVDCDDPDCATAPVCNVVDCVADTTIGCDAVVQGTTVGGADEMVYYPCATWEESGPEVVYSFTSDTTEVVTFTLSDLAVDLDLFVLGGGCNNTNCALAGDARVSFVAEAGETYHIVVDGYLGAEGAYTLTSSCAAEEIERTCDDGLDNDLDELVDCDDPDCEGDPACAPQLCTAQGAIGCGETLEGTTLGEFANLTDYACLDWPVTGPEYVATFTTDVDRVVTLDLEALGDVPADLDLLVLADSCDAAACVAGESTEGNPETLSFPAVAGTTYFVVVDGFAGAAGDFALTATCDAGCEDDPFEDNDTQETAAALTAGETATAAICAGDDDWFAVDVPAGCTITALAEFFHGDGDLDMTLHAPDGTQLDSSTSGSDNEEVSAVAETGGLYAISVYGYLDAENTYALTATLDCGEALCDDGVDNDGDDLVDCDDDDCADDPACASCEDTYEPNDDTGTATALELGVPQDHTICPVGDHDFFAITLDAATRVTIEADGPSGDAFLTLYDADGNEIGADDDSGPGLFPSLTSDFEAGTYYVEINELGDDSLIEAYTIAATAVAACVDDDFEDNDTLETATPTPSGIYDAVIVDGDWDYHAIELCAGAVLTATVEFDGSSTDLDTDLYDAAGDRITGSSGFGDVEEIVFTAEVAGTYYFRIEEYGGADTCEPYVVTIAIDESGCGPLVEVCDNQVDDDGDDLVDCLDDDCLDDPACIAEVCDNQVDDDGDGAVDCDDDECLGVPPCPCLPDIYEPSDEAATATPILLNEVLDVSICPAGDVDWFVFTLDAPTGVTIETAGAEGDTTLTLLDANGEVVTSNDDIDLIGGNTFSRITTELAAGTYYAEVHEFNDDDPIYDYTLSLYACQVDAYEVDDSVDAATTLVAGDDPQAHSLCPAGDVDWYTFTLDTLADVVIRTTGEPIDGPSGDTVMTLFDADGNEVATNDDPVPGVFYAALTVWDLPAGTYSVRVSGIDPAVAVPGYDIVLETTILACPGDDQYEENDTLVTAAGLAPATTIRGVRCDGDDDWYGIPVTGGCRVDAELLFIHDDGDLDLRLVNAQNQLVQGSTSTDDNEAISAIVPLTGDYYLRVFFGENRYALTYTVTCPTPEICDDGVDNDLDGAVDCADDDCAQDPTCTELICDDGVDNDGDELVDCADPDCAALPLCLDDAFEENDTFDTAVPGPPGGAPDLISRDGDEDWFLYEVCVGGTIDVGLVFFDADGDIDLYLRDADDNGLDSGTSTSDNEEASWTNDTGAVAPVYVRVRNWTTDAITPYDMVVTIACPEICDDGVDNDGDDLVDCDDESCVGDAACPALPAPGFAQIQWPVDPIVISETDDLPLIYGRVFVDGVTPDDGKGFGVRGQLGYGPDGSDPAADGGWTWVEGVYNGELGNDDELRATPDGIGVGLWDYAWRFTTDNGTTWVYADLPPGTEDGYSVDTTGSIEVQSGCIDDPYEPNDDFATATAGGAGIWNGVIADGTYDYYAVDACAGAVLTFTAEFDPAVDIDIDIYDGAETRIGGSSGLTGVETATVTSETDQTIYVRIEEYATGTCASYDLTIEIDETGCAPVPDGTCAAPLPIACGDVVTMSNEAGAANFDTYPGCGTWTETGPEIIYALPLDGAYDVTLTLSGRDQADIDLFVLSECTADACLGFTGQSDTFALDAGTWIIAADGYDGSIGTYTLTVGCTPQFETSCDDQLDNDGDGLVDCDDDDCAADAACLPAFSCADPGVFTGDTVAGTNDGLGDNHVGACTFGTGGAEAVWSWTPETAGTYCLTTAGSGYDTVLYVRTACDDELGEVACDDDGGPGSTSQVDVHVNRGGGTYWVFVDGYSASSLGTYDLTITSGPCVLAQTETCDDGIDNDGDGLADCADDECVADAACEGEICAQPFVFDGTQATGTVDLLTGDEHAVCNRDQGGRDVVFAWTAAADGTICLDTHGSTYDTTLGVVAATCDGQALVCNDDADGPALSTSSLSFDAVAGTTYYIFLDGYGSGSRGDYVLTATPGGCVERTCDDGADGDRDGLVDCDDPDCAGVGDCAAAEPNPFFYIYMEGSSFNKALEIVNYPGAGPIDLATCSVDVYFNGGTTPQSIQLDPVTLQAGEVFVICHSSFDVVDPATVCDQQTGSLGFNGDDAVALTCGGTTYDVIGRIGEDPGSFWGTDPFVTQNQTLVRQYATTGDPDGTDAFDPGNGEWEIDGVDDASGLGVWPYGT